ncbi:MAG: hypothetical protein IT379_33595, partial [Deltaproteobacteria bacterium]|nr:hypothetical protein [Deltaproteobacteria bacterium]
MNARTGLLALGAIATIACVDDVPPTVPAAALVGSAGPWMEGSTFVAGVSIYDTQLRVVSTDEGVVEVLSDAIETYTDGGCVPFCPGFAGGFRVRAVAVGTADLQLLDGDGRLLDSQIVGVARPDRVELLTVVGTGPSFGFPLAIGGDTIEGDSLAVLAFEQFEIEALPSVGSSTILGGRIEGTIDGAPTCLVETTERARLRVNPLGVGAHELVVRFAGVERRLAIEAIAVTSLAALELRTVPGAPGFGSTAVRARGVSASGEPVHFVRNVSWRVLAPDLVDVSLASESGSTLLDSSGLFGTSRSATRRVIAELADHVAMIEV